MNIELWKQRKKELKLTHDELANLSGISRRTIAGIFGRDPRYASPTLNTVEAIERALGLNEKNQALQEEHYSNEEREIISMYRHLPDKLKKLVYEQLVIYSEPKT